MISRLSACFGLFLWFTWSAAGQPAAVPRVTYFSGIVKDAAGRPQTGTVGITFSLYEEQQGGTALWSEIQNVPLDDQGRYTVLIGAITPTGLPLDLFASGKARWLSVEPQVAGTVDQPRVLLVGVPYALKAADADTLGGLPASAFLQAAAPAQPASGSGTQAELARDVSSNAACASITSDGTATANQVALFTSACNIEPSTITETGGKVGIGTSAPAATLDVKGTTTVRGTLTMNAKGSATASAGSDSNALDLIAASFNASTAASVNQHFRWQAEPADNDTVVPAGSLNLLFASGNGTPIETGLSITSQGTINFAPGQAFPGGTVTGVNAGTDLLGGGTGGVVTISLDTTKVPTLGGANNYTASQTTNGQWISTAATGIAPMAVNSTTQVPNLNASLLGGLSASAFQPAGSYAGLGSSNTFTASQATSGQWISTAGAGTAPLVVSSTTQVPNLNASLLGGLSASAFQPAGSYAGLGSNTFSGTETLNAQGTAVASAGANSYPLDWIAEAFNSSTSSSVNQRFQWMAEPVGNDTASPSGKLSLQFGAGAATPAETGLSISSSGILTFAPGQTFPGAGGTITAVTAGTDLTGGGTSGTVTLNLDTTKVPQLANANTFTGNQTVNGTVSGTQLISSAATGTAPLVVSSTTQVPNLNASLLGSLSATAFQPAGSYATLGSNTFSGTQIISSGNLALPATGVLTGLLSLGGQPFLHAYGSVNNTFLGQNAGNFTQSGTGQYVDNTGVGAGALQSLTTAEGSTAVGAYAMNKTTFGYDDTAVGDFALYSNTSGGANVAVGEQALYLNSTGSNNTAIGAYAGFSGTDSGPNNTTGSNNTFIGSGAGPGTTTQLNNAAAIGANALVSESNALVLGGTGANAVNVGIGTPTPSATLEVNGTGKFDGLVTFVSGQTFPGTGTGNGTITGVTAGRYLTGGGTSGSVALNLDTTSVPLLAAPNSFTGNQSVAGSITATQGVVAAQFQATIATGTAPLVVNSTTQVPNLNASLLGGQSASAFATLSGTNNFTGGLDLNGELNGDYGNTNTGALIPGIEFGHPTGEGISSKRTSGGNQWGLDFYTNTTPRMSITNSGNVGIGTTSPLTTLEVNGTVRADVSLFVNGGSTFVGGSTFDQAPSFLQGIGVTGNGSITGSVIADSSSTNGGALSPGLNLGNGGEGISSARQISATNRYGLDFYTNSTKRMSITNGGSVGIGTANPAQALEVNGSSQVDGAAYFNGGAQIEGTAANSGFMALNVIGGPGIGAQIVNNATTDTLPALMLLNTATSGETWTLIAGNNTNPLSNNCVMDNVGDLDCSGQISGVSFQIGVDTVSHADPASHVALYPVGAAENWFEDAGYGQLSKGGASVILDPAFADTVNTGVGYHVFLTPEGDCDGLYVTNKTAGSFEVHELRGGHSNITFSYRIMARRQGYENVRLERGKPAARSVRTTAAAKVR